ncbi:hypothetical protein HPB50_028267 [Hyalomma asiaticum]|nr:hypothetical protein HPB50_028267 [Hyalomma asiaticum]
MCDISARMHCLAERSKNGQTVTGKYANAMRVSNSIAAATARPTFFRFISFETRAPNLRRTVPKGDAASVRVVRRTPGKSEETHASLSTRFPPCATEPSDESSRLLDAWKAAKKPTRRCRLGFHRARLSSDESYVGLLKVPSDCKSFKSENFGASTSGMEVMAGGCEGCGVDPGTPMPTGAAMTVTVITCCRSSETTCSRLIGDPSVRPTRYWTTSS